MHLLDFLFPPRKTEVLVREAGPLQLHELLNPTHIGGVVGLLPYRNPLVQATIVEAKFFGKKNAQGALGAILADFLKEETEYVLIPVPLSKARRAKRGYNQVEEICMQAVTKGATLEPGLVVRTRDTKPQTSLSGTERRENMKGAFTLTRPPSSSHTYIVVDDVTTTGATLTAVCEALTQGGATKIKSIALAH